MNNIADHKLSFASFSSELFGPATQTRMPWRPRVLVVDDEPRLLSSMVELLKARDVELSTADCGHKALDQLSKDKFDLVILDMGLPDMSGLEIMGFINTNNLDTDVIVVSGNSDIDSAIGALKRGAFDYLRKPYAREELLRTVDNALAQRNLKTDNRRITLQLENSEKTYRYFVDNSPDIIYALDDKGLFTFVNVRVEQLLGFSREELIGTHYSALIHGDDLERARYVFNERRVGERASSNIELRLKSHKLPGETLVFESSLMTISFSSIGMYSSDANKGNSAFFGTYGVARDITARKRAEELIVYQAYHDILTDLPNRSLFKDRLGLSIIQSQRNATKLAVMFIDLDRFKLVNDTMGHVTGDELLRQVAARLKGCLRRGDTLARMGGDEFIFLMSDLRDKRDVVEIAEKFLKSLQQSFFLGSNEARISASIGIALYPDDGSSIDELIRHADLAMYHVKALGKNGHAFYDGSMVDASYQKLALEKDLRKALECGELEMYYQPQVNVYTGHIVGAEALMRWNHPERGLLIPGDFLPFAEENGLIVPISEWMLEAVCSDLIERNASGADPLKISLNVSPQSLERGFSKQLKNVLTRYDIPPNQIEVEITENICIRNPDHAIEQLNMLSQIGVSVAIDDFGTGYSSLSYLQRFPIHTIKIDQSFVKEIYVDNAHSPIVLAIISIAKGLGLNVIAEGVETEVQARYLERVGCTVMQGYFYHRPLSRHFLSQLLAQQLSQKIPGIRQTLSGLPG